MFQQLMNGDEVSQILNISRSFAYQLMRQGIIPTVKLGHSVRVRPEDLEVFISEGGRAKVDVEADNKMDPS